MSGSDFKIRVEGEQAEAVAAELAELVEKELEYKPTVQRENKAVRDSDEPKKIDPNWIAAGAAVLAVILTIPSSILASMDIVDRISKKKKVDSLIENCKLIIQDKDSGQIRIIIPDGKSLSLNMADAQTIIDIATEAETG